MKGRIKYVYLLYLFFISVPLYSYIGDGKGIVINEVQPKGDGTTSNPDWVELYNKATQPVDIAYWILNNQNDTDWDNVDNNLIIWKNGESYNDTSYPHCHNSIPSGNDCLYMIPYDPATTTDTDCSNDYTLYVDPGCYVVIYSTSGNNDYSCDGDNVIRLYMGYDNQDVFIQDGDDVSLIPYFFYRAYDNNGNKTEEGYIWLVMDYVGWDPSNGNGNYNEHPNHCGAISNGTFYEYPTFGGHFETNGDISDQCDINILYYYLGIYHIPFNFSSDFSTHYMDPLTSPLHSSYSRVPNGTDSDSTSDWAVVSDTPGTTDVKMSNVSMKVIDGKTIFQWRVLFETGIIGYNVFGGVDGKFIKLNRKIIYAKGDGTTYSFTYNGVVKDINLQVIEYGDHSYFIGPYSVNSSEKVKTYGEEPVIPKFLIAGESSPKSEGCSEGGGYPEIWVILLLMGIFLFF